MLHRASRQGLPCTGNPRIKSQALSRWQDQPAHHVVHSVHSWLSFSRLLCSFMGQPGLSAEPCSERDGWGGAGLLQSMSCCCSD